MSKTQTRNVQVEVQQAIDQMVESGAERGIQVAVYRHGELEVDAVMGVADPTTRRLVTPDTPFYNFSICKGAASTLVHMLAERGLFGYETPVAELWPEFAAHGKQGVTIRHVLTHSAGVPGIPLTTTLGDLCDWDRMCAAIADEELWWEPGTKIGYHAYTFGYIVGELIRRVTGKPISQVLLEELAGPLGIGDEIYFGMPRLQQRRLARLEDTPSPTPMKMLPMSPDLPMFKAGPISLYPTAELGNRPDILAADIPAGGKTSARAIARMYAAMLDEVDGIRLLSPERLRQATAVAMSGIDAVFGNPTTWALGYAVGRPGSSPEESPTAFGIGGAGGSRVRRHRDRHRVRNDQEPFDARLQSGDGDHPPGDQLAVCLGLANALAERLEEAVGHLGMVHEERLEVPLRNRRQGHIGVRCDGRASLSSSAISPKESPGPSFTLRPLTVATVTVPSVMTMNPTPPSPRTMISCPAGCLTVFNCFLIERISESGRPWNSLACFNSTTRRY